MRALGNILRSLGALCILCAVPVAAAGADPPSSPVPLPTGESASAVTGLQAFTILQSSGILRGTGQKQLVTPGSQIKLDELLTLLARGTALSGAAPIVTPVPGATPAAAWYAESVQAAISRDILSGLPMGPTDTVAREQAAVILVRTAQSQGALQLGFIPAQLPDLFDADRIDRKYRRYVLLAIYARLLPAYPDGYFRPKQPLSWGEASQATLKLNQAAGGQRPR